MPRKKCYGSEAEKQRAYRLRKRMVLVEKEGVSDNERRETGLGQDSAGVVQNQERGKEHPETVGVMTGSPVQSLSKQILPVPVLAERGTGVENGKPAQVLNASELLHASQAQESTTQEVEPNEMIRNSDSRGGQTLSLTDQKFEEDRPGWYIFGKEVKERNCWKCGKDFKTRLEMNKFCSPKCKNGYLDTAFTKLRNQ